MSIQIRTADLNDIPVLLQFQQEAWFEDYLNVIPPAYAQYAIGVYGTKEALHQQIEGDNLYLVAEVNNKVVACATAEILNDDEAELWWIHTTKSYRGRGIGRRLIDGITTQLTNKVPKLCVTTFQDYTATLKFYEHLGFQVQKKFIYETQGFQISEVRLYRILPSQKENRIMSEFWEMAFQEKKMMWGGEPITVAIEASETFKELGFKKILIPGFGYGRNAKPFYAKGFEVTGIEISSTAIKLAHEFLGEEIRVFHGSVDDMPFDQDVYDGIFCHALIHLLDSGQRKKLIQDCYHQLQHDGLMVFTTITKDASTYGVGEKLGTDRYRTQHGVDLYFYDEDSIKQAFGEFGLIEATKIDEDGNRRPATKFWKIVCKR